MEEKEFDLRNPPRGISYMEPSKTKPAGYRAKINLYDQWDERRTLTKTFRADDNTDDTLYKTLQKAIEYRDDIEDKKTDIRWLKRKFPNPKDKEKFDSPEELFEWGDRHTPDKSDDTLRDFVERGMKRNQHGSLVEEPRSTEMGYLRRLKADTSIDNFKFHCGVWSVIIEWGGIHTKTVDDITGTDVDDFVRWCEQQQDDDEDYRYSKSTIKNYRARLRSMIKRFAIDQEEVNPLDITPSLRDPRQIKGRSKKRKCPTEDEMTVLEQGFARWVDQAPDRYRPIRTVCHKVYHVLRYTGMRPSEAFALTPAHINVIQDKITVNSAITNDGEGQTKSGKLGAEDAGRTVPVASHVTDMITDWIEEREELGFPTIQDQPLIFCNTDGDPLSDDVLRDHFKKACKAYEGTIDADQYVTPYQLRHWRNDQLRKRGCPVEVRSAVIGHDKDVNPDYTDVKTEEVVDYLEG